jgi:uncharacterized protein (UPF0548 family)
MVAAFLAQQEAQRFSYREVGATRDNSFAPAGYNLDHNRVRLGNGDAVFAQACEALRAWRMFPAPWTRIAPTAAASRVGQTVAMQAHALGLWWMNACRIVYVIDEATPLRRFGFAYGTLAAHVEQGEERFTVELHANGEVWYDLRAFSRPRYWPVRLGKPLVRRLQRRFVRDSQRAMLQAVNDGAQA